MEIKSSRESENIILQCYFSSKPSGYMAYRVGAYLWNNFLAGISLVGIIHSIINANVGVAFIFGVLMLLSLIIKLNFNYRTGTAYNPEEEGV